MPKDPVQAFKVDEAIGLDDDLRREMRPSIMLSYDQTIKPKEKARKVKEMGEKLAANEIPRFLSHFEKMLEKSEYLCGLGDNRRCTVPHYVQVVGKRRHRPYSRRHHDQVPEHHRVSGEDGGQAGDRGVPQQAQVRRRREGYEPEMEVVACCYRTHLRERRDRQQRNRSSIRWQSLPQRNSVGSIFLTLLLRSSAPRHVWSAVGGEKSRSAQPARHTAAARWGCRTTITTAKHGPPASRCCAATETGRRGT